MAKRKTTRRKTSYHAKEEEMLQKLYKTLGALLFSVVLIFVVFKFFGPKVGVALSFLSKNRNDQGIGDIVPPTTPFFSDIPEATNKDEITLNGITEPGATVKLFVNGPEKEKTTADSDGNFTFIDIKLIDGRNIIFAKATDSENNESEKSEVIMISQDKEDPEIEILEPANGATIKNLNKRVMVKGNANEEVSVKINGRQAITNPDNSFELLLGVSEGAVEIKIEVTDKAGNSIEKKIYITYKKSS